MMFVEREKCAGGLWGWAGGRWGGLVKQDPGGRHNCGAAFGAH